MKSENKYIGDDAFNKFIEHYECPSSLTEIKLKFAGAICSPNLDLKPVDVIASFWPQDEQPRLQTKKEADLFFKFFMGLWDDIFERVKQNNIKLSPVKLKSKEDIKEACHERFIDVELGFVEGFWGGQENLNIPAFVAQMIDSITELAGVYKDLSKKIDNNPDLDEITQTFTYTDKMVEKAISFIVENNVLPRIDDLARTVN